MHFVCLSQSNDALYLKFTSKSKLCCSLKLTITSKINDKIVQCETTGSISDVKIPIQKGKYKVFVESTLFLPIIIPEIETNIHYFAIELFSDPIIKDTLIVNPAHSVTVSTGLERLQYLNKLTEKDDLAINQYFKWDNPFELDWGYFNQQDSLHTANANSDIYCDLYVEIRKPSRYTWNSIKSDFSYKRWIAKCPKNKLYLDDNFFTVIAYISPSLSFVSKETMTENELLYNKVIFNIYELSARKLRFYLSNNNSRDIYRYREAILTHAKDACHKLLTSFKIETENGRNQEQLFIWHKFIFNQLVMYDKYRDNKYTPFIGRK